MKEGSITILQRIRKKSKDIPSGAGTKSRTRDLLITNQLLYQLSYTGELQILH